MMYQDRVRSAGRLLECTVLQTGIDLHIEDCRTVVLTSFTFHDLEHAIFQIDCLGFSSEHDGVASFHG